ncbi:MAG: hypothetical protein ACK5JF_03875 [Oscillospiraceae bacterium]
MPTRDNLTEELIVAYVLINSGQTSITQAAVTDTRLDGTLCGLMRDGVSGIPTAGLQEQAKQLLDLIEAELDSLNAGTEVMLKTDYAPDSTAGIENGELRVISSHPHLGSKYDVRFDMPLDYTPVSKVFIDNIECTIRNPKTMVEMLYENAPTAPSWLERNGTDAFIQSGGATPEIPTEYRRIFYATTATWPGDEREGDILAVYS